jgi:MoaA/NifB/PqqE/SkfB family radical SAM enzyme
MSTLARLVPATRRSTRLALALWRDRPLPFSITFILTHRCNFRCRHCDVPAAAGDEMGRDELCRAIDDLSGAGMARASFSGGEALLRPDALDVIAHAHDRGVTTSLNSNAWSIERHLERLAGILDVLMVSLDGPEPVHDLVRARRGSYARAVRAIEGARARGIVVTTITTLSAANLDVVDDVLALARQLGFWAYFQPAYRQCFSRAGGLDPALSSAVLTDLARRLEQARAEGAPVGASRGYTQRLAAAPSFGDCSRCAAGRYFATLMPDGTFVPCHLSAGDHPYPNGRRLGFVEAFHRIPRPRPGPGCAISPYQEQDLIFGLDGAAIRGAVARLWGSPAPRPSAT